ncbi:MAG: hypothetical protein AAB217_02700 [Chloroflexota bacterium]
MKSSFAERLSVFVLLAGGLSAALAGAGLLAGLYQSDGLIRYPEAMRLARPDFQLGALFISQYEVYGAADDALAVMRWYARQGFSPDEAGKAMGNCLSLAKVDERWGLQQMASVTLCVQSKGTLIFVNRNLMLDW